MATELRFDSSSVYIRYIYYFCRDMRYVQQLMISQNYPFSSSNRSWSLVVPFYNTFIILNLNIIFHSFSTDCITQFENMENYLLISSSWALLGTGGVAGGDFGECWSRAKGRMEGCWTQTGISCSPNRVFYKAAGST